VTNDIKIKAAYIKFQDALDLPRIELLHKITRRPDAQIGRRVKSGYKRKYKNATANEETSEVSDFQSSEEDGLHTESSCATAKGTAQRPSSQSPAFPGDVQSRNSQFIGCRFHSNAGITFNFSTSAESQEIFAASKVSAGDLKLRSEFRPAHRGRHRKDAATMDFRRWLSQVWLFPRLSNFGRSLPIKHPEPKTYDNPVVLAEGDALAPPDEQSYAEHDLPLLFAGIMSYVFGQNVSVDDVSVFLGQCLQNHILGLLTCVLGIGLYRYIMKRCTVTIPFTAERLILEDAYGRTRPFSLDMCMDYDLFKKFLEVHYQDTTGTAAGALVKTGQFHIMLGSRRGKILERSNWRCDLLKPGYRVVNSVYVNKEDATCLTCATVMTVTALGEFHW